jgi:hypothetical protein
MASVSTHTIPRRKKGLFVLVTLTIVLAALLLISYVVAKTKAHKVAAQFAGDLSPLKGRLVLFVDGNFVPLWIFRAEYEQALTGATFDVYVSLCGTELQPPGHSKREDVHP